MALHTRLASHVFDSFEAFRDWMITQQFDIAVNPDRAPILSAGQRIAIRDTNNLYITLKRIENVADVLDVSISGEFRAKLKEDQDYMAAMFAPPIPRIAVHTAPAPGDLTLQMSEDLLVQNAVVTLNFDGQEENLKKASNIFVLNDGNVTLNTGKFNVVTWFGAKKESYKPNKNIKLERNSCYYCVLQSETVVQVIETGKSRFTLLQEINTDPDGASKDEIPSEYAVSQSLYDLNNKLLEAIRNNTGFLFYSGIDPETNSVIRIKEGEPYSDVWTIANNEEGLEPPKVAGQYALVLNNENSVFVYKSIELVAPTYSENPKYLGSGVYTGEVNQELRIAYPNAVEGDIVGNEATGTEWEFDGVSWFETIRPFDDSKNFPSSNYLGVYDVRKVNSQQNKAIDLIFPLAEEGNIVNNLLTNTEWTKRPSGNWIDTGNPLGFSDVALNPLVSGSFDWDPNNKKQVQGLLSYKIDLETVADRDVVCIKNGTEWVFDANLKGGSWVDTGKEEGTSSHIPNPQYLGKDNYGKGDEAANNLQIKFSNEQEKDVVGNYDTDTDWMFDGDVWIDTGDPIGTYSTIPNPKYLGVLDFNKEDAEAVNSVLSSLYKNAKTDYIVYNEMSGTEWKLDEYGTWFDTYYPNHTTPERVPNPAILGSFNYLESWLAPDRALKDLFPNASFGSFVCNLSTGTEWEYRRDTLNWHDTGRPIGTTPVEGNSKYLGTAMYKTFPPTDNYILLNVFPDAKEGQFVTNNTTGTQWLFQNGSWYDTKTNNLVRWGYEQQGTYGWDNTGISGISGGSLFHVLSRYPETSKSEVYWFANSWNYLDFDAVQILPFTDDTTGTLQGKQEFGYIHSVQDEDGNTFGKVYGLTVEGQGKKVLADNGEYIYPNQKTPMLEGVTLYIDPINGHDENNGVTRDTPWQTFARLHLYINNISPIYDYTINSGNYPKKVVLYILDGNAEQDIVLEHIPYLEVIGLGTNHTLAKRLHIINSTIVIKDIKIEGAVVAWQSKVLVSNALSCKAIDLIESNLEQRSRIIFQEAENQFAPIINIDNRSSYYHNSSTLSNAPLDKGTPFLNVEGTYIKGASGAFEKPALGYLTGIKIKVGPLGRIVGSTMEWLYDNIWYRGYAVQDTETPVSVPSLRTLYGDSDKTGFQIADGTDLGELIKAQGISVVPSLAEAYRIPEKDRYLGKLVYVEQLRGFYYWKDGLFDRDLVKFIVPHYNINYIINPCCFGEYEWIHQFPFQNVDNENWLTLEDQTMDSQFSDYVLNTDIDWDSVVEPGKYYIQSRPGETFNAPVNVLAWWWLIVGTHLFNEGQPDEEMRVIQKARRSDISSQALYRVYENGAWTPWSYNYAQYAG